ncbi:MAG TPA: tripartite tricarboxylate transporter substrate binding protein [Usitatibacter sp.]|nr:tripartite tricarboxylate transporter substrate binding protein [Usitatibacter sp.]
MKSLVTSGLAALAFTVSLAAHAQEWPTQPVKILVPFPPGGTTDQIARHVQQPLSQILGQPVVVENRGGGSGSIGAAMVAKAPPDGSTWLLSFDTHGVNPSLIPNLPFDTLKDLTQVMLVGTSPMLITAHPSTPYKTFSEVLAAAKKDGNAISFGTIGSGSLGHLAMQLVQTEVGAKMTHIPYKGGGPLVQDAIAGHVPIAIGSAALMSPSVKAGRLRAIGVTSPKRFPPMAEVATIAEQGVPNFDSEAWWGLHAPAGTPAPIIAKMHKAFSEALRNPAVQEKLTAQGVVLRTSSPQEFSKFLENEVTRWSKVVKDNKISAQ